MSTKIRWTTNNQHYDEIVAAQNAALTGKPPDILAEADKRGMKLSLDAANNLDNVLPDTKAKKIAESLYERSRTSQNHSEELRTSAGGGVTYTGNMSDEHAPPFENGQRVKYTGPVFEEISDLYPDNEWLRRNFRDRYKLFNDDPNDWVHSLLAWFTSGFRLQRTQVSRADALRKFIKSFRPACGWIDGVPITPMSQMWEHDHQAHIFLIQHDWAAAFAGDSEFDSKANESQLPAPTCFFEYTVSGRHVIAVAPSCHDDPLGLAIAIPKCPTMDRSGWFIKGNNSRGSTFDIFGPNADAAWQGHRRLGQFLNHQVRAASIALEAEVAETEVVRVPFKLNAARARRGQTKLPDYHVLNLANRKRYTPLPDDLAGGEKRRSPRLHFRRSHWRHFENYRVRIKWQLVGNPDIGFIDKDYKL